MKYRTGKDEKSEVRVYKHLPEGWKVLKGTQTQPVGTVWASNGEPVFKRGKDGKLHKNPKYKQALVVRDEKLMVTRIAQARRYERNDRFIADQTTEKKIQAEMRRQERERKKRESLDRTRPVVTGKKPSSKPAKKPASKRPMTALERSVKPTTDKVGDVLVNQSGVKYTIIGEKYGPAKGYDDGKTKVRRLVVRADGGGTFEIGDHAFKHYRDSKVLKRVPASKPAKKPAARGRKK